jgi:hypothetical protein
MPVPIIPSIPAEPAIYRQANPPKAIYMNALNKTIAIIRPAPILMTISAIFIIAKTI